MADPTSAQIGERIRSLRKQLGMTQEQLAYKTGVRQSSVVKWEKKGLDVDRLRLIAKALGVTVIALLAPVDERLKDAG